MEGRLPFQVALAARNAAAAWQHQASGIRIIPVLDMHEAAVRPATESSRLHDTCQRSAMAGMCRFVSYLHT